MWLTKFSERKFINDYMVTMKPVHLVEGYVFNLNPHQTKQRIEIIGFNTTVRRKSKL